MVATAVLTAKGTPKAEERIFMAQDEKGEPLTVTETVAAAAPSYIPAAMVGIGTIICIFGANVLNYQQQAMLMSSYAALESTYQEYRNKVDTICGPGTSNFIDRAIEQEHQDEEDGEPPWDRIETFYIEGLENPRFFEATMQRVMEAEYHLNRNFILRGYVTLNEFLDFLDLPPEENGNIGWDRCDGEAFYGYCWIDFDHQYYTTDEDLRVCAIKMPFPPHAM